MESCSSQTSKALSAAQNPAFTVKIVDGSYVDVNLETVDSFGQAKVRIGEALGENPYAIIVLGEDGNPLGNCRPLSNLATHEIEVMVVGDLTPHSPTPHEFPPIAAERDRSLTVKIFGGKHFNVNLTSVETVGQAKIQICTALGKSPDEIAICSGDDIELEESLALSALTIPELQVMVLAGDAQTSPPTFESQCDPLPAKSSIISVRMMLTGAALNVDVDSTLPVVVAREQIAMALGMGEHQITLVDPHGGQLAKTYIPSKLGLAEIGVIKRRRRVVLGPRMCGKAINEGDKLRASRRLFKELHDATNQAPLGYTFEIADTSVEDSIFCWRVCFPWPEGMYRPDHEDRCELIMSAPFDYPFTPPEIRVASDMQHRIVSAEGRVMMDILRDQWSATFTFLTLALYVQCEFTEDA